MNRCRPSGARSRWAPASSPARDAWATYSAICRRGYRAPARCSCACSGTKRKGCSTPTYATCAGWASTARWSRWTDTGCRWELPIHGELYKARPEAQAVLPRPTPTTVLVGHHRRPGVAAHLRLLRPPEPRAPPSRGIPVYPRSVAHRTTPELAAGLHGPRWATATAASCADTALTVHRPHDRKPWTLLALRLEMLAKVTLGRPPALPEDAPLEPLPQAGPRRLRLRVGKQGPPGRRPRKSTSGPWKPLRAAGWRIWWGCRPRD